MTLLAALDWQTFFFTMFALIACVFGAGVLFSSNVVRMAFYLVISLGATAGLFFLAGAEFVGAMQLMIYVGGTLVLLIFGVMLTAQERFINMKPRAGEWILAVILGSSLLALLVASAFSVDQWRTGHPAPDQVTLADVESSSPIGAALAGIRVDKLDEPDPVLRAGMSGYLLPFVIVSVHLLVVLVGAAYMARTKRFRTAVEVAQITGSVEPKRRGWLTTVLLAVLLVGHLAGLGTYLFFGDQWRSLALFDGLPGWLVHGTTVLMIVGTFSILALLNWQRWGYYGLVAVAIADAGMTAVAAGGLLALGHVIGSAVGLGLLFGLMQLGGQRSYWAQLD